MQYTSIGGLGQGLQDPELNGGADFDARWSGQDKGPAGSPYEIERACAWEDNCGANATCVGCRSFYNRP